MKYIILFTLLFVCNQLYSQTSGKDTIENASNMFANIYYHNGQKVIGMVALKQIVSENPEANEHMRKALNNYYFGFTSGFVGGAVFGYALGGLAGTKEFLPVAGVGVGLIFISYFLDNESKSHVNEAIEKYNKSAGNLGLNEKYLKFGFTKSGVALIF